MKVSELIDALKRLPADADVTLLWDGEARSEAEFAWLARGWYVVLSDADEVVYEEVDRPENAPNEEYWRTPAINRLQITQPGEEPGAPRSPLPPRP